MPVGRLLLEVTAGYLADVSDQIDHDLANTLLNQAGQELDIVLVSEA